MLDRAHIGEAELFGQLRELERLTPVMIGALLIGTDGGEELDTEFHQSACSLVVLPAKPVPA